MGGAHAIAALAYGTGSVPRGRRDRRARAASTSRRPSGRSCAATSASTASPDRATCSSSPPRAPTRAWWPLDLLRPGRARRGHARRARSRDDPALLDALDRRRRAAGGRGARRRARTSTPRSRSPRPSRPSTSSSSATAAEALAPRVRSAGCLFVGAQSATAFGDYVAGSNHTLPTGRRRALRLGAQRPRTSAGGSARCASAGAAGALARARGGDRRAPRASPSTRPRWRYGENRSS